MSNYINRNELIELIKKMPSEVIPRADDYKKVVLCKDCGYYRTLSTVRKNTGHCAFWNNVTDATGYCYGAYKKANKQTERKEE